jgi:hypothetical protein
MPVERSSDHVSRERLERVPRNDPVLDEPEERGHKNSREKEQGAQDRSPGDAGRDRLPPIPERGDLAHKDDRDSQRNESEDRVLDAQREAEREPGKRDVPAHPPLIPRFAPAPAVLPAQGHQHHERARQHEPGDDEIVLRYPRLKENHRRRHEHDGRYGGRARPRTELARDPVERHPREKRERKLNERGQPIRPGEERDQDGYLAVPRIERGDRPVVPQVAALKPGDGLRHVIGEHVPAAGRRRESQHDGVGQKGECHDRNGDRGRPVAGRYVRRLRVGGAGFLGRNAPHPTCKKPERRGDYQRDHSDPMRSNDRPPECGGGDARDLKRDNDRPEERHRENGQPRCQRGPQTRDRGGSQAG